MVSGTCLSLGLPIEAGRQPIATQRSPAQHFMARDGGDYAADLPERPGFGFADDYLLIACHGTTHIDALSHIWREGLMWNGFSKDTVTSRGAARCGIEKVGPLVTRGLVLDLVPEGHVGLDPGHEITVDELIAATRRSGVQPEPGDALLLRTGWLARWREKTADASSWPGIGADSAEWLGEQGFAIVGADNLAVEASPSSDPSCAAPLHVKAMRDRGIYLMELLDLEQLVQQGRHTFLLIVAPLAIAGGVGSPVAPVAVI